MKNLQKGDIVFRLYHGRVEEMFPICRTTKTLAFGSTGCKLKIGVSDSGVIQSGDWDIFDYVVSSPEIIARHNRSVIYKFLFGGSMKFTHLTMPQLERILGVMGVTRHYSDGILQPLQLPLL